MSHNDEPAGVGVGVGAAALPELPGDQRMLLEAIVSLRDVDEARALFCDLFTPREVEDLSQRLVVARMLDAGASYLRIQQATGVSATTVSRVARCLKYGTGGYRMVLDRLPAYEEPEAAGMENAPGAGE